VIPTPVPKKIPTPSSSSSESSDSESSYSTSSSEEKAASSKSALVVSVPKAGKKPSSSDSSESSDSEESSSEDKVVSDKQSDSSSGSSSSAGSTVVISQTPKTNKVPDQEQPAASEVAEIFVGNLDWNTTEDDLSAHFKKFGQIVKINMPIDRESGRPRGFGFIGFNDPLEADKAVKEADNTEFMGRQLKVNFSKGKAGDGGRQNNQRGGKRDAPYGENRSSSARGYGASSYGQGSSGGTTCFKCGKEGHFSRQCPQGGGGGYGASSYGQGSSGGTTCFKCGKEGHFSRECPQGGGGKRGARS